MAQPSRLVRLTRHLDRLAALHGLALNSNDCGIRRHRNCHRGKRAFLIGNGPSLRISDLDRLRGELCFGSNKIYLAFEQSAWRPEYILMEDAQVIQQTRDKLHRLDGIKLLMPHTARMPSYDNVFYYHYNWLKLPPPLQPDFGRDPLVSFYWGFTITFTMLQWAWYCGVREVYLLGIDFNYTITHPEKIRQQGLTKYYESAGEATHFHKDYYPAGTNWMVPDLAYQGKAFEAARDFYAAHGGTIHNATRGGHLEIFPRVDFDDLCSRLAAPASPGGVRIA